MTKTGIALLAGFVLALPALAQVAPAPPSRFEGLWTPWRGANRDSLRAEVEARRRAAAEGASGPADRQRRYAEAASLGERVGRIVGEGDCEEGERIARQAGDFALVRAVRGHCGLAADTAR